MNSRAIAVILGLVAFVVLAAASPLVFTTMEVRGAGYTGNCGTVFAGSGTWTYASPYSTRPDIDAVDYATRGQGAVEDAVSELLASADAGAEAYDACQSAHTTRRIILGVLGVSAIAIFGVAAWFWAASRRSSAVH